MQTDQAKDNWEAHHAEHARSRPTPRWPNETLVKLLFGSYLAKPVQVNKDWRILDIGCGYGNNLLPFLHAGCACHAVEVTDGMAETTRRMLADSGWNVPVGTGDNRHLPYPDNHFDMLLSVNTLHYETSEDEIDTALTEYSRVLKPKGALFVSTVGPNHEIYEDSEVVGPHRFICRNYGFRSGEKFYWFDNEKYLDYQLSKHFNHVETGRVTERLMTRQLDFLIAVAQFKAD